MPSADAIGAAAELIKHANSLLITAGAGIGVDSGLPDFRGDHGFWKAYPPLGRAGIRFVEMANPASFTDDPARAWGFYGHRLRLYRDTVPHEGFAILRRLAEGMPGGVFIFTSNVDGQFQAAGFDPERIVECHGSIHHLQCLRPCSGHLWPATGFNPLVDETQCRIATAPPACPECGGLARPNVLMFNDSNWIPDRTDAQFDRFEAWLRVARDLVVIEIGAGTAIPSVRRQGEALGVPLIRINPDAAQVSRDGDVALQAGALEALRSIQLRI